VATKTLAFVRRAGATTPDEPKPAFAPRSRHFPTAAGVAMSLCGRTALFQVLEREERGRHTVPPLGKNLDDKDKSRLAKLGQRPDGLPQTAAAPRPIKPPPSWSKSRRFTCRRTESGR
jgi:hypothetical protein